MSKDLTKNMIASQDEKLDRIITAIEALDTRLQTVETGQKAMAVEIRGISARLDSLETKVEERLKDTRPMWEAVQVQLTELRSEFKADLGRLQLEFKADLEKLRNETEKGFRRLGHKIGLEHQTVEDLHADLRDQEERLDKLEKVEG